MGKLEDFSLDRNLIEKAPGCDTQRLIYQEYNNRCNKWEESIIRNTALLMYNSRNVRFYLPRWRNQGVFWWVKAPLPFRKNFGSKKLSKIGKK